jgi:hypothetical protein
VRRRPQANEELHPRLKISAEPHPSGKARAITLAAVDNFCSARFNFQRKPQLKLILHISFNFSKKILKEDSSKLVGKMVRGA